jgi:hypothetical protein
MVEQLASQNAWNFDRLADDQIVMSIEALWRTYAITLALSNKEEMLKLACSFEIAPLENSAEQIYETLNVINDSIWTGTFTYTSAQNLIIYRYGLVLNDDAEVTDGQIDQILSDAINSCDCFYPTLQKVIWGGQNPSDAVGIAMMMPQGEA